jgi:hypothetical protein
VKSASVLPRPRFGRSPGWSLPAYRISANMMLQTACLRPLSVNPMVEYILKLVPCVSTHSTKQPGLRQTLQALCEQLRGYCAFCFTEAVFRRSCLSRKPFRHSTSRYSIVVGRRAVESTLSRVVKVADGAVWGELLKWFSGLNDRLTKPRVSAAVVHVARRQLGT